MKKMNEHTKAKAKAIAIGVAKYAGAIGLAAGSWVLGAKVGQTKDNAAVALASVAIVTAGCAAGGIIGEKAIEEACDKVIYENECEKIENEIIDKMGEA